MFFWNSKKWIVLCVYFRWSNIGYSSWLIYPYIITILNNPSKLLTIKKYLTLYWYIIYYKCKYGQLSKYMQSFFCLKLSWFLGMVPKIGVGPMCSFGWFVWRQFTCVMKAAAGDICGMKLPINNQFHCGQTALSYQHCCNQLDCAGLDWAGMDYNIQYTIYSPVKYTVFTS